MRKTGQAEGPPGADRIVVDRWDIMIQEMYNAGCCEREISQRGLGTYLETGEGGKTTTAAALTSPYSVLSSPKGYASAHDGAELELNMTTRKPLVLIPRSAAVFPSSQDQCQ